jgi:putative membrane protein
MNIRSWLAALLVISGASSVACGGGNSASEGESSSSNVPAASEGDEDPTTSGEQRLTDAQIMSVVSAANAGEIAQANAALPKLTNGDAMAFAKMMVEMHTAAQERQNTMAQQKGVTPETNALSTQLAQDSDDVLKELSTADRDEVDQLYMEKQVEQHEKVLETLDEKLIPSATDPALQQELQTSRSEVSAHLTRAREIVESLD